MAYLLTTRLQRVGTEQQIPRAVAPRGVMAEGFGPPTANFQAVTPHRSVLFFADPLAKF